MPPPEEGEPEPQSGAGATAQGDASHPRGGGSHGGGGVELPPRLFLPLCRRYCPHAYLSLGWRVGPIGPEEAYTPHDVSEL